MYGYTPFDFFIYICFVLKKHSVAAHSHSKNISVNDIILNTKSRQFHSNRIVDNKTLMFFILLYTYVYPWVYLYIK